MNKLKRPVSMLLSFLLLLSIAAAAPVSVSALIADGYKYSDPVNGKVTIEQYLGSDESVEIPAEIEGNTVTKIGKNAFQSRSTIKNVTIPSSVTEIGIEAFAECSNLESVTVPNGVTKIWERAFYGCSKLTKVVLPASITQSDGGIGAQAFGNCGSEMIVYAPSGSFAEEWATAAGYTVINSGFTFFFIRGMNKFAVTGYTGAEAEIDIPYFDINSGRRIECVAANVFSGNKNLKSVTFPHMTEFTTIGENSFKDCSNLKKVVIPENVTTIGDNAFDGCSPGLKIYGQSGSAAERYVTAYNFANKNNNKKIQFVDYYGFTYSEPENDKVAVTGYTGTSTELEIPSEFDGCAVTEIDSQAFHDRTDITSVTIPDTIESIGSSAFNGCTGLTEIAIPKSVTSIGDKAFEGCSNLKKAVISDSVNYVGIDSFAGCGFFDSECKKPKPKIYGQSGSRVHMYAFMNGFTFIENDCFTFSEPKNGTVCITGYVGTKSDIEIPAEIGDDAVVSIGEYAFLNNTSLTSVAIPNSVKSIGKSAFAGCSGLASAVVPPSVTTVGVNAFYKCAPDLAVRGKEPSAARDYTKNTSYSFDGSSYFNYSAIGSSNTAELKQYIGSDVKVKVDSEYDGKTVTRIGAYAFAGNTDVSVIVIPDGVTHIGDHAFAGCTNLVRITIPESVTDICDDKVFEGCSSNLTIIGKTGTETERFADYFGYTYLDLEFVSSPAEDFTFSEPVNGEVEVTGYKGDGGDVIIPPYYDGCPVTRIGTGAFAHRYQVTSVTIPDGVTEIGNSAFYNCKNLASVTLPDDLKTIGRDAFNACKLLRRVTLPDAVTRIGDYAFGNSGLYSISLGKNVETIGKYAFYNCVNMSELNIPGSVEEIGDRAFYNCSTLAEDISLKNVSSIGDYAFQNCTNLDSVTIPNTKASFKGAHVFSGTKSGFKIYGYVSSTAEKFAQDNAIPFFALDEYESPAPAKFYYKKKGDTKVTYVSSFPVAWFEVDEEGGVLGILEDITLASRLKVYGDVTIELNGHVIDRNLIDRSTEGGDSAIILDRNAKLTIYGGTKANPEPVCRNAVKAWSTAGTKKTFTIENRGVITGGSTDANGGGILVNDGATLNLHYTAVSGNYAAANNNEYGKGGGVCLYGNFAHMNMYHSEISHNFGRFGGGVAVVSGKEEFTRSYDNSTIVGDTDADKGDILSSVSSNYTYFLGGGMYVDNTNCTIDGLSIDNNYSDEVKGATSTYGGGGMYLTGNNTTVRNCIIRANSTKGLGGGVYNTTNNLKTAEANTFKDVRVTENTAVYYGDGICNGGVDIRFSGYCYVNDNGNDNKHENLSLRFIGLGISGGEMKYSGHVLIDHNEPEGSCYKYKLDKKSRIYISIQDADPRKLNGTGSDLFITNKLFANITGFMECGAEEHGPFPIEGKGYLQDLLTDSVNENINEICEVNWASMVNCFRFDNYEDAMYQYHIEAVSEEFSVSDVHSYFYGIENGSGDPTECLYYLKNTDNNKHKVCFKVVYGAGENDDGWLAPAKYPTRKASTVANTYVGEDGQYHVDPDKSFVTEDGQVYAIKQGIYTFSSEYTDTNDKTVAFDADGLFYYSDGYFMNDAKVYNTHLATLSACMANAAFNSTTSTVGDHGCYTFKGKNIRQMMMDMGCKNSDIYMSDTYATKPDYDTIGYCIGTKKLPNNDDLVIIAVRGGYYEAEWAGNFWLDKSGEHAGFSCAAGQVFEGLNNFLEKKGIDGTDSTTKFWIAGYSRAGATSNLTAKRIVDKYDNLGERTFAYPIEPPKGGLESKKKKFTEGPNEGKYYGFDPDGKYEGYCCIHNVLNYCDIVPWVAMGEMDFIRYGVDHFVPGNNVENGYTEGVPHDNYTEIVGSDTYKAQKKEMIKQLKYLNKHLVYDDYFHTATIMYSSLAANMSADHLIQRDPHSSGVDTVEEWLPLFFKHFTEWTLGEDARSTYNYKHYVKKAPSGTSSLHAAKTKMYVNEEDEYGSKSFQESLMAIIKLVMSPSDEADQFAGSFSGAMDKILDKDGLSGVIQKGKLGKKAVDLLSSICRYFNSNSRSSRWGFELLEFLAESATGNLVDFDFDKDLEEIFSGVWDILKKLLKSGDISDSKIEDYKGYFHTAFVYVMGYAKTDYQKNDQDDIGTLAYNVGRLMSNHTPEIAISWIRSYDSYYTGANAINAPVEYTGNNTPNPASVEVTSGSTTTKYDYDNNYDYNQRDNVINVGLNDEIRFVPEDSGYDRDYGDTYYYYIPGSGYSDGDYWHIVNDSFTLDELIEEYRLDKSDSYKIYVMSFRDDNLYSSNSSKPVSFEDIIKEYKQISPTDVRLDSLVHAYTFNVAESKPSLAMARRYEPVPEEYEYAESLVDEGSTRTLSGVKPGEETDADRWKFDHWAVYPYNTETGEPDEANPVDPGAYAELFGENFDPEAEETEVTYNDSGNNNYLFKPVYTKLLTCTFMVPESYDSESGTYTYTAKVLAYDPDNPVYTDIEAIKPGAADEDREFTFKSWNVYPYDVLTGAVDRDHPLGASQFADVLGEGYQSWSNTTTVTNLTNQSYLFEPVYESYNIGSESVFIVPKSYDEENDELTYSAIALDYEDGNPKALEIKAVKPGVDTDSDRWIFDHWEVYSCDTPSGESTSGDDTIEENYSLGKTDWESLAQVNVTDNPDAFKLIPEGEYERLFGSSFNAKSAITTVYNMTDGDYKFVPVYKKRPTCTFMLPESYNAENENYNYTDKPVACDPDSPVTVTINAVTPGEAPEGNIWVFDGWVVYPYEPVTGVVDTDNPVEVDKYAELFGDDFNAYSEQATVTNLTYQSFSFKPQYSSAAISVSSEISYEMGMGTLTRPNFQYLYDWDPDGIDMEREIALEGRNNIFTYKVHGLSNFWTDVWGAGPGGKTGWIEITGFNSKGIVPRNMVFPSNITVAYSSYLHGRRIRTFPVMAVGNIDAARNDKWKVVSSMIIGDGISSVGAFYNFSALTSVTLSSTVRQFGGCRKCLNLEEMYIPGNCLNSGCYRGCEKLNTVILDEGVTSIDEYAFADCPKINDDSVSIPYTVSSIGNAAFENATGLKNFVWPDFIKSIGNSTFKGCTNLESIDLHENIEAIGQYAFSGCTSLESITIPHKVKALYETFNTCTSLRSVTFSEDSELETIGAYTFIRCTSLPSITLPESVKVIRYSAFRESENLESVNLPSALQEIGPSAFADCTSLKNIDISVNGVDLNINDSVVSDGYGDTQNMTKGVFENCRALESITIPGRVVRIGRQAFNYCTRLENVTMLDGKPSTIGERAFENCWSLGEFTTSDTVETLEDYIFSGCSRLCSVTLGDRVYKIYIFAFANKDRTPLKIRTLSVNGSNHPDFGTTKSYGVKHLPKETVTHLIVRGTNIMNNAFCDYKELTKLTFADTVTSIGEYSFGGATSLKELEIPGTITNIGYEAFYSCRNLRDLKLSEGIETIGGLAFRYTGIRYLTIPDSVTSIGESAFGNCPDLWSVTIGSGDRDVALTSLAPGAFSKVNNLTVVGDGDFDYNNLPAVGTKLTVTGDTIKDGAFSSKDPFPSGVLTIADSVVTVGERAFENWGTIGAVVIGDNVQTLPQSAFAGTTTGELSVKGDGVYDYNILPKSKVRRLTVRGESIKPSAFAGYPELEYVNINETIESIGAYAFTNCPIIERLSLPESITTISEGAFQGCSGIEKINLGRHITTIGERAFSGCVSLDGVVLPDTVTALDSGAFSNCTSLKSIAIPDQVEHIGSQAFYNCTGLRSLVLTEGTSSIGNQAFYNCESLNGVEFPNSLRTIGSDAFNSCSKLEELSIHKDVSSIGSAAFNGCENLETAFVFGRNTAVGANAFANCPDLTLYAYDSSPADYHAAGLDIPFFPIVRTNVGSEYEDEPLNKTQTCEENVMAKYGIYFDMFNNLELIGAQLKTDEGTNDMRFVAVLNEGIVAEATRSHDIEDYGFVIAKTRASSTATASEEVIQKVQLGAPNTVTYSCKSTSNKISGDYGIYSKKNTKYKYITLGVKNADANPNQGLVVRFYVKTKSGRIYYAKYNTDFSGCAASYSKLFEGENTTLFSDDWQGMTPFKEED